MVRMITKSLMVAVSVVVVSSVRAAIADPCNTSPATVANAGERYVQETQRQEDAQLDVAEQAKIGGTIVLPLSLSPETHKDDLAPLLPQGEIPSKMADRAC
jgi:hypothetical protein